MASEAASIAAAAAAAAAEATAAAAAAEEEEKDALTAAAAAGGTEEKDARKRTFHAGMGGSGEEHGCVSRSAWKIGSRFMNRRAKANQAYIPTDEEHLANVITHGLWILPSVGGLYWMTLLSANEIQRITAIIYGLSLFFLFTVSTTFHSLAYSGRFCELKNVFHIGDRAVIYVFIAASYTPWLTLKDFNQSSITVLLIVWLGSLLGIIYQYTYHEQYKWLETLLYMLIGVAPSIIVLEMKDPSGLHELAIGGAVYMAGVVFFKCDGVIPFAHAIWHSFVIVGAVVHFIAVCNHLLGPGKPPPSP